MAKARLEELYFSTIRKDLKNELDIPNIEQVPRLVKIVVNVGTKKAVGNSKILKGIQEKINQITGQASVITKAKKSIASFKLREGMPLGVMVTLRRKRMYEFFDRLISAALPQVRDFQGVSTKFDQQGNYNLGISEWSIFPEIEYVVGAEAHGMNITFHIESESKEHSRRLLEKFGVPFRKARA